MLRLMRSSPAPFKEIAMCTKSITLRKEYSLLIKFRNFWLYAPVMKIPGIFERIVNYLCMLVKRNTLLEKGVGVKMYEC